MRNVEKRISWIILLFLLSMLLRCAREDVPSPQPSAPSPSLQATTTSTNVPLPTITPTVTVAVPEVLPTSPYSSPMILDEAFQVIDSREPYFDGKLSMVIELVDVQIEQHSDGTPYVLVGLRVIIRNETSTPITFHKPRRAGMTHLFLPSLELDIRLWTLDGQRIEPRSYTGASGPSGVSEDEFTLVYPDQPFEQIYHFPIVEVITDSENQTPETLAPGIYQMSARHNNSLLIGPVDHTGIYDWEAWVGMMESNYIEFEMPDLSEVEP